MNIKSKLLICFLLGFVCILTGCSSVKVHTVETTKYISTQRGDVITSGNLSRPTINVLYILNNTPEQCEAEFDRCYKSILSTSLLSQEQQFSALSEIWLLHSMKLSKQFREIQSSASDEEIIKLQQQRIDSFLQSARYAYAYLFYTNRNLSERALEDRQTQVRDYYNFSTEKTIELLYESKQNGIRLKNDKASYISVLDWKIYINEKHLPSLDLHNDSIKNVIPDTTLTFDGLKNQYTREGIGSRMVVTLDTDETKDTKSWKRMPYLPVTSIIQFRGRNLKDILNTQEVAIIPFDPYVNDHIRIQQETVPLGANYSSAYGLWLAESDFTTQSLGTIFGKGNVLDKPTLYLMKPYQPNLKTIILIHGLASSPEAWVNAANEIMGDDILRKNYQIWQIYYPTSVPIMINRADIARVIKEALDYYDPKRKNPASRDIVLVGHSMGGILSRLLVSDSKNHFWDSFSTKRTFSLTEQKLLRKELDEYIFFKPLPEVKRAIFLAAPHRGTPFADRSFARWLAGLVKLPFSLLNRFSNATLLILGKDIPHEKISQTGVDNLSAKDPVILESAKLQISPKVTYHSIIATEDPSIPLQDSSDGIVPYSSSHWEGAESELIVVSGHSVQETSQAILEIRRILRLHLEN
ncbi:MAG: alpha/beta hydrolase [Burkholderiaceae bacterium]|nr:alpha/beta hydrolase [Burkholderiaceae bacterium]